MGGELAGVSREICGHAARAGNLPLFYADLVFQGIKITAFLHNVAHHVVHVDITRYDHGCLGDLFEHTCKGLAV